MVILSQIDIKKTSGELLKISTFNIGLSSYAKPSVNLVQKAKKNNDLTIKSKNHLKTPDNIQNKVNVANASIVTQNQQSEENLESKSSLNSNQQGSEDSTIIYKAKYRHQTPPIYPNRAIELGLEGEVNLHVRILENGYPEKLKIVKSSGYSLLDRAALAAVKKWRFEPLSINGSIVAAWVNVPINFIIQ